MSYDLMVFDLEIAPASREHFLDWYDSRMEAEQEYPDWDDSDPKNCTANLKAFYSEMLPDFPAMNGPDASDDVDNSNITDYSFEDGFIYMNFGWSVAEAAYKAVLAAAKKHNVGFFDVSSEDGVVWMPRPDGSYSIVHRGK